MTDRELLQQALDALTQANQCIFTSAKLPFPPALNATSKAAEALRARLAEPEPEVRWDASAPLVVHPHPAFQATPPQQHSEQWWRHEVSNAWAEGYEKGRASVKQAEQELVAWSRVNMNDHKEGDLGIGTVKWDASAPLVVTPHPAFKKLWVGLTDEEIIACIQRGKSDDLGDYVKPLATSRAVEAKLKQKNT